MARREGKKRKDKNKGRKAPLIALAGITKRFPGVLANDHVDLAIHAGEVHVLLGENGAGKSTLIGILSGQSAPDEGTIRIDGAARRIASPKQALALGIGTVFQHSMLVPTLSVVDNLALGGRWWQRTDRAQLAARLRQTASSFGLAVEPEALAGELSPAVQRLAALAKFRPSALKPRVAVVEGLTDPITGLMMGNHALVRAMVESGTMVVAAYPGSPTPEIFHRPCSGAPVADRNCAG